MRMKRLHVLRHKLAAHNRRRRHPVLARALGNLGDGEIDTALESADLSRADLFTPRNAIAAHRVRMACMLRAFEVDVHDAVARYWDALKRADHNCSRCMEAGRCRRWLEWGGMNDAPLVFCPNAAAFRTLAVEQARRELSGYMA